MIYSYAAEDVHVVIGGMTIEGYNDGSFVTIETPEEIFKTKRTSSGKVVRTRIKNNIYKLTLSLHQTSESNDTLWRLLTLDKKLGDAIFPIFIKDSGSATSILAAQAWICNLPTITYSDGMEVREWELEFTSESISVSGGTDGESFLESAIKLFSSGIL